MFFFIIFGRWIASRQVLPQVLVLYFCKFEQSTPFVCNLTGKLDVDFDVQSRGEKKTAWA
jgi:hypothetical protein